MMYFKIKFILFEYLVLLIINTHANTANAVCSSIINAINCNGFNSFKDVVLNTTQTKIKSITLTPSTQLLLNDDLNLRNLAFEENFEFTIEKIKGIQAELDPFSIDNTRTGKFYVSNSIFETYNENVVIDSFESCLSLFDSFFISIFDDFDFVSLRENITYPPELCPAIFMGTIIETIEFFSLTQANRPNFIDLNSSDADLMDSISNLKIFNSQIFLDDKLFTKNIFKYTKSLLINNSSLIDIQDGLFTEFNDLKSIELKLNNYEEFIQTSSMSWLKSLNSNVTDGLNTLDEQQQMFITLTDLTEKYDYPDKDICKFKDFPHERLVFPIINAKPSLDCTCTLIWLLQYKDRVSGGSQILETSSTRNCLNKPDFNKQVSDCNYPDRLTECDFVPPNDKCTFKKNSISCANFSAFDELNFSGMSGLFQSVSIEPFQPILLDSSLDFQDISFTDSFSAKFSNIKGFNMVNIVLFNFFVSN